MECGWSEGKGTILALRGRAICCRLLPRDGRPKSRFAAESPAPASANSLQYQAAALSGVAPLARGSLRPPRRLKA
ncbi:hypothetical protein [Burkholderia sp. S-53]|uniref:hypothetical protein n=1 Tax=Burkholderia sp. S-53 TaxID=2906514 RepID=UPI0021CEE4D2|nr:hypothetical protein [Burkholderia sp. S-53]UXU86822.1 hypothetical protein LXM88_16815 [Burkholderia sp. S-53]